MKKVKIKAQFLLLGFNSEFDEIILDSQFRIYRGSETELELFYSRHNISFEREKDTFFCECIIVDKEFSNNTKHLNHPWYILEIFFKLLLNTDVRFPYVSQFIEKEGSSDFIPIGAVKSNKMSPFVYSIFELKKESLNDFLRIWKRINEKRVIDDGALNVAFRRTIFAGQKYEQEDILIDLMIAFEALFLNEMSELSYRLAIRVTTLLSEDFNGLDIFSFIKKSYDIRSKIVHGSIVKLKDFNFDSNNISNALKRTNANLLDLLIHSFQIYVLESEESSVTKFIKSIDHKLINKLG